MLFQAKVQPESTPIPLPSTPRSLASTPQSSDYGKPDWHDSWKDPEASPCPPPRYYDMDIKEDIEGEVICYQGDWRPRSSRSPGTPPSIGRDSWKDPEAPSPSLTDDYYTLPRPRAQSYDSVTIGEIEDEIDYYRDFWRNRGSYCPSPSPSVGPDPYDMNNIDEIEDEVMDNSLPSRPLYPYEEVPEEKPMGFAWTVDYDSDFFPDDQDSGDDVYVSQSLSLSAQTSDEMPPSGTQPCTSSKSDSYSDSSPNEMGMIDDIITTQPLVVSAQIPDEILPHITHPIKTALIGEFRNRTKDGILRSLSGSVCDLILSNNFDQNDVLRIYRGPKSIEQPHLVLLRSLIDDECRRSPTMAASLTNLIILPTDHNFALWDCWVMCYRFYLPVLRKKLVLLVRPGPIHDKSELEVIDTKDRFGVRNPPPSWQSARHWLRDRFGQYTLRQFQLETFRKQSNMRFSLMNLPAELRCRIFQYVIGGQIWPHLHTCCCRKDMKSDHCDERNMSKTIRTPHRPGGPFYRYYDVSHPAIESYRSLGPTIPFHAPYANGRPERHLYTRERFMRPSYGFGYHDYDFEKEKDPMAFSAPEDTHVGLGPTLEEQTSIMNMLLVSKELRHEFQDSLWGGSWYRFNKPHVFDQTVHSLTLYCLPYTKPDGTLSNFNPKILSKVWLSMANIDYLDFVGFAYEDGRFRLTNKRYLGQSHARGLDLLSKIATLKHLHLEFMVLTPVVGVNQDPFVGQARVEGRHQDGQLVSCQQKFVDMVLTLGYEVFQTFAEVTISGHVKKSNHDTWDLRLGKGTREMLNLDDKVAEYLALRPDELPLKCECLPRCEWWNTGLPWNGDRHYFYEGDDECHVDPVLCREFSCEDNQSSDV